MYIDTMIEKIEREMEEKEKVVNCIKKFMEYENGKRLEYKELKNKTNENDFSKVLEKIKKLENLQISIDK